MILAKKVSPRAFKVVPNKKGEAAGEIGIEGTTIEAPEEVGGFKFWAMSSFSTCCSCKAASCKGLCVSLGLWASCTPHSPSFSSANCHRSAVLMQSRAVSGPVVQHKT